MIQGGMLVFDGADYRWAIPYISNGTSWERVFAYVYDDNTLQWKMLGAAGVPMVYWLTSDGQYMMRGNDYILVRQEYNLNYLKDADNKFLFTSNNMKLAFNGG